MPVCRKGSYPVPIREATAFAGIWFQRNAREAAHCLSDVHIGQRSRLLDGHCVDELVRYLLGSAGCGNGGSSRFVRDDLHRGLGYSYFISNGRVCNRRHA
jgi:hypothetical protein